jgi:hypothetical protein
MMVNGVNRKRLDAEQRAAVENRVREGQRQLRRDIAAERKRAFRPLAPYLRHAEIR